MHLFSVWIICHFYHAVDFIVTDDNTTAASPHPPSQIMPPKSESCFGFWILTFMIKM